MTEGTGLVAAEWTKILSGSMQIAVTRTENPGNALWNGFAWRKLSLREL